MTTAIRMAALGKAATSTATSPPSRRITTLTSISPSWPMPTRLGPWATLLSA